MNDQREAATGEEPTAAKNHEACISVAVSAVDLLCARFAIRDACQTFDLTPEHLAACCTALVDNEIPLARGHELIDEEWGDREIWPVEVIDAAYAVAWEAEQAIRDELRKKAEASEKWFAEHIKGPDLDLPEEMDFSVEPPPIEWLVDRIAELDTVQMYYAPPSSLKTWAMLSMCASIAQGKPWLGRFPVKQGNVLYLDWESSRQAIVRRMRILLKGANPKGFFYKRHWGDPHKEEFWETLSAFFRAHAIALVVYDTLGGATGGDVKENEAEFSGAVKAAGKIDGVTHIFLHHSTKADPKNARGTGSLLAAVDSAFYLDEAKGNRRTGLTTTLHLKKAGDGEQEEVIHLRFTEGDGLQIVNARPEGHVGPEGASLDKLIDLQLASGPKGTEALREALGVGKKPLQEKLKVKEERGQIFRRGPRSDWNSDSDTRRRQRILALWPEGISLRASLDGDDLQEGLRAHRSC